MEKAERVMEGLNLPNKPASPPLTKVKEIVLKPIMTNDEIKAREGTYFDEKTIKTMIEEDTDIYGIDPDDPDGNKKKLLAKFRKNVIPHDIVKQGWQNYCYQRRF